jgi:uncharacterized protein involved in exopolysaccharide biosynthesis
MEEALTKIHNTMAPSGAKALTSPDNRVRLPEQSAMGENPSEVPLQPHRYRSAKLVFILILPVLVTALVAFIVAWQSKPIYAARSEVMLDLRRLPWDVAERVVATEVVVAQSRALLAPVADSFQIPVRDLERNFSPELIRNSSVVRLQYEHVNPTLALEITRAITDRYVATLQNLSSEETRTRILTPPFILEEPISPKPLRAAAAGAAIGMLLAAAGATLWIQPWRTTHQA